ncbi:MAG: DNA replication/repair protein RecF [Alphaproteobacteria bacterium]|jgi:DNA replication and repair protein RecF|nr:DNA replication/repair protein RecF [Alphaproteobacteria bacterium]
MDSPEVLAPARPLAVTRLVVRDFRSYRAGDISLDARPVVLTGPNGAGKTNLLEAVSYLGPGRGLRQAKLGEVTRRALGESAPPPDRGWSVSARLSTPLGAVAIGTGLDPAAPSGTARRVVRIDGRTAASQAELADYLAVVWLIPAMDRLFLEGAGNRRRFLDRLVFAFHADHAARLSAYERAMRERNRLLKEPRWDTAWLAALEEAMAANGVAVAAARREVAARLAASARQVSPARGRAPWGTGDGGGAFPGAAPTVSGALEDGLADSPALALEDRYRARLAGIRPVDAAAGMATEGPHRSDLAVVHVEKGCPAGQCSTGEQKALLITLVLAHARLLAAEQGAPPLLLLDEVAAHLDARRRSALFEAILAVGAQAWLTGTDPALFRELGSAVQHHVVVDATLSDAPLDPGS